MPSDDGRSTTANMSPEQRARADALGIARWVLGVRRDPDGNRVVDVVDLVAVAQWVLTGEEPFTTRATEAVTQLDGTVLPLSGGGDS
jgi:hypothetical protein